MEIIIKHKDKEHSIYVSNILEVNIDIERLKKTIIISLRNQIKWSLNDKINEAKSIEELFNKK